MKDGSNQVELLLCGWEVCTPPPHPPLAEEQMINSELGVQSKRVR